MTQRSDQKGEAGTQATERTIDVSGLSEDENHALDYWCHFCGRTQAEVQKLIAGQGVYVCDFCTSELPSKVPQDAEGTIVELPLAQPVGRPQPGWLAMHGLGSGFGLDVADRAPIAEPESFRNFQARIAQNASQVPRRCGFCGKSQEQVRVLFYAGFSFICDECVHLSGEIVEEERRGS